MIKEMMTMMIMMMTTMGSMIMTMMMMEGEGRERKAEISRE